MVSPPGTVFAPPVLRNVDYRSPADDAWYAVRLAVEGGTTLRVMYCNFSPEHDDFYLAENLSGPGKVEALRERFRASSVQLQDQDCRSVVQGTKVCASHAFGEDDLRFFDAVVSSVIRAKHIVVNGATVCNCKFILIWQHGPLVGQQTIVSVQQICVVPFRSPHNPTLDNFLGMVSAGHTETTTTSEEHTSKKHDERIMDHSKPNDTAKRPSNHMKFEIPQSMDLKRRPKSVGLKRPPQPMYHDVSSPKPKNNGGTSYSLWVDNLEKDVSHITISDYLYEQTSIDCHVQLSHCSMPTTCYGGMIIVKNERHAKKLLNFLLDPAHIVVSSRGRRFLSYLCRPWFIKEDWCQVVEDAFPRDEINRSNKAQQDSSKLRLVYKGTREYERAKDVQRLHFEFHNHVEKLLRTLDLEEKRVMLQRG
ncbi:uncharacterized protein LOC121995823 isoform X1 [Zingiber officinale]|uniref:SAWADEE domain-containing protein n=1 Tax=Zingiber officinale TaxID=94328 RepID=A0A8J5G5M4_ZINOF|nr:uncharacterized protein LOC121995823 isoform X1 [Zingiber officinale]KAG6498862.1 hypothetical protein ZIOFF_038612 [Zingiber officinale]